MNSSRLALCSLLLLAACWQVADYFPLENGMRWESRQVKLTIADQETTRTERTIRTIVRERIVYGNLGPVTDVAEIVERDTTHRYYRRKIDGTWLLWETMGEKPDSAHILPAMPAPGQVWTFRSRAKTAIACTVAARVTETVPAGTFRDCLAVRFLFTGVEGASETRWFAPNVGVIRDEYQRVQERDGHVFRELSRTELLSFRPR
jgi:hypothetical protein